MSELVQVNPRNTSKLCCAVVIAVLAGCDAFLSPIPPGDSTKPPGSDLSSAKPIELDADGNTVLTGTVSDADNVHVYDLGACARGDRIAITVEPAVGSSMDPVLAVFDANEDLFALNDDVDVAASVLSSAIDEVVTIAGNHYYLAISKFFSGATGGNYVATIHIERGGAVPSRPVQVLLLNFAGGEVTILGEGTITFDPFDAADVDAAYAGKTDEIKAKIAEVVRENYEDTGVAVVTSDDPAPAPGTFSTIHFGAYSPTKFGVAQSVDQGNKDRCDDGIVFTEQFDDPFAAQPSVVGLSTAIANVAAHEAGHLLGLNHVSDVTALMDTTGTASTLLADQEFKSAPLHPSVFPLGTQNAPVMLDRIVPP
ncbi:MAG: matrixin family metalloprotease [Planctomycetota bacterium]